MLNIKIHRQGIALSTLVHLIGGHNSGKNVIKDLGQIADQLLPIIQDQAIGLGGGIDFSVNENRDKLTYSEDDNVVAEIYF